jgi:hypothetical protein
MPSELAVLRRCTPNAVRLYLNGLLRIVDHADARVAGQRHLTLTHLVSEVGPVAMPDHVHRKLQFAELIRLLDELTEVGAVTYTLDDHWLDVQLVQLVQRVGDKVGA